MAYLWCVPRHGFPGPLVRRVTPSRAVNERPSLVLKGSPVVADSFAPLFTWITGVGEFGMVMLSGERAGKPYTDAYVSRYVGGNRKAFAMVDLSPGSPYESFDHWRYSATGWRPNGDTPSQQKYPV